MSRVMWAPGITLGLNYVLVYCWGSMADSKKVHLYLPSAMGIKLNLVHRRLGSYEGGRGVGWERGLHVRKYVVGKGES